MDHFYMLRSAVFCAVFLKRKPRHQTSRRGETTMTADFVMKRGGDHLGVKSAEGEVITV